MVKFGWDKLKRFLAQAQTWTGVQTFSSIVATTADINGGTIDNTAIGGATPAAIQSLNKEVIVPDTVALTALQCSGTIINNFGMADADAVIDLPAAAVGLSFVVVLSAARAKYYRLRCLDAANDKIYLDGVAGADGGYVSIAAAVIGASIQFFTFQTEAAAFDWYAVTISGSWIAG